MTTWPNGAIKTCEEFIALKGQKVWEASRKFGIHGPKICTGEIGTDRSGTKHPYRWYKTRELFGHMHHESSRLDMHIGLDQDYNDWFMFSDEALARAYVEEKAP